MKNTLTEASITCFLALVETMNFTQAAKELSISQQSVSQHISKLEKELGFPLFVRSPRSVVLTKAGQAYSEFFFDFRNKYRKLYDSCLTQYGKGAHSLSIGFQNCTMLGAAVERATSRIQTETPELDIQVVCNAPDILLDSFRKCNTDIIILFERFIPQGESMNCLTLLEVERMLLVPPKRSSSKENATYRDFQQEPYIVDRYGYESAAETEKRSRAELNRLDFEPDSFIVAPDRESAYTALELGLGVLIGTSLSRVSHNKTLLSYPVNDKDRLCCVWRSDSDTQLAERYALALQDEYSQIPSAE